jgi:filamentous hemagglutinin family protein
MYCRRRSLNLITLPIASSITWCLLAPLTPAMAQIIPDGTLGAQPSVVTPNVTIKGIPSDQIDGGAIRGANLFHSFQDFNIGAFRGAYFSNPTGIVNILSRITGTNPSNIQGTLGVLGNANLFLINPNGIVFGSSSRLDVRGAFVATTANSLLFDNGVEFSATHPQAPPLLSINIPIGLHYRTPQPGALVNAGNLAVQPGQNLTLVGGTVATTGQLWASGGQLSVVAVPGESFVQLGSAGQLLSVSPTTNAQSTTPRGRSLPELLNTVGYDTGLTAVGNTHVVLKGSDTPIPAHIGTVIVSGILDASNLAGGKTGGTIQLLGNKVGLFDSARINASGDVGGGSVLIGGNYQGQGILPNALATYVAPGVTINADAVNSGNGGQIVVWANESTRAYGTLSARGGEQSGNGGLIETSSLTFLDVSGIRVDATAGKGLSGTWLIDPRNIIIQNVAASNGTFSSATPDGFTPGGDNAVVSTQDIESQLNAGTNVTITTGSTSNQEGNITVMDSITKTTGGSATLSLLAANNITFNSGVKITSNSDALNLILTADSDRSGAGDVVMNNTRIQANSGLIGITANSVLLENKSDVHTDANGKVNGGSIVVNAGSVRLRESGMGSTTVGEGNAGQVIINADTVSFEKGSGLGTWSDEGSGNAGQIYINANSLSLKGSAFDSTAYRDGNAGQINITANSIVFTEASAFASGVLGKGKAGQVNVTANSIFMTGNGGISTKAEGSGDGGQINVTAHSLVLQGSGFTSQTTSTGNGGQINVTADFVLLDGDNFGISTDSSNSGKGGDITLHVGELIVRGGSKIAVRSFGTGGAGTVSIVADSIRLDTEGDINAATVSGQGGNINLTAQDIQLRRGSNITTNATGTANGGNISIDTGVLVALENSDISANSTDARGGNITINTQGIFGTAFRPTRTPDSDITATGADSSLSGNVTINRFGIDPTTGLVVLPENVIDPATLIAQNPCERGKGSAFVVTGRGGLPGNPSEPLSSEAVRVGLVEPAPIGEQGSRGVEEQENKRTAVNSKSPISNPVVPVMGWVFNNKGEVVLTAYAPTNTQLQQRLWTNPAACQAH